jgi:hypothetical protein
MKSMFKGALGALMVMLALCGMTAASALAAGAPMVETKAANGVKETTASLNGVVNPNGAETKDYFEYGPTASYGSKSREQTTTVEKKPDILVEGLTRGTTYHFRMVAKNSYGTSYGADETFTTAAEKPEAAVTSGKITELAVTASSSGTGWVEWSADKSVECNSSRFTGHFLNAKELEGTMEIYGCAQEGGYGCANEHTGEGVIQSEPLVGVLGYTNKAKKEVGLRLSGKSSEVWAKNVDCLGNTNPLTASLGGTLGLQVNTKIPAGGGFTIEYKEKEDKQITGELGGQLLWDEGYMEFGIESSLKASANKEFEIKA